MVTNPGHHVASWFSAWATPFPIWVREVILSVPMTISRDTRVDLDGLVAEMLDTGPDEVSCPSRLPQYDFECIRDVIRRVIRMYHPMERNVPWQPGPRSMSGVTLMALIKNRDYQAADDYLVVEGSFLPA